MRRAEKKNPFPPKGMLNLEAGTRDQLPTMPTPPMERTYQRAADYVSTYIGDVVTVTGPYGSGKTHLIYYVLQKTVQEWADASPRPVQLYAKGGSYDFLAVYRELAGQLDLPLLRKLNARFLGRAVSEEMSREHQQIIQQLRKDFKGDREADVSGVKAEENISERVLAQLRKDPNTVYRYLDQLLVTPERALGERSSEVRNITKAGRDDFKKAIFYLDDEELAADAHDWLIARQDLPSDAMLRLGVRGQIADADDALDALRLLVHLFRSAEIPLLVYIDQIEQLLVDIDKELARANAERLKSTVEYFANNNAFLLLSGADEAWSYFREDFFGRVGPPISIEQITPKQSRDLIKVYLQEGVTYQTYKEPSEILPFTPEGIDEILRLRGGNMRRFLQTCHDVYARLMKEEREGVIIDPPFVQQVVQDYGGFDKGFFNREMVSDEIRNILRRKDIRFQTQANLTKNFRPDFVIEDVKNPSVVIEISESLFYKDEAEKALGIVRFRQNLVEAYPKTRLIVIPMGYVSPEVLTHLRGVVDSCIVYEAEGFTELFEATIDSLVAPEKEVLRPEVDQRIKDEFETVANSIQKLLSTREGEIEALNMRLETFLRTQTEERQKSISAQRHEEWRSWLRQDQQRWEQRQAELKRKPDDERRRLQQEGETLRWRQPIIAFIPYLVMSGVVALLMYFALPFYIYSDFIFYIRGPISLSFGLLMMTCRYFLSTHRKLFPLGFRRSSEVATFSGDLGQLALRVKISSVSHFEARLCIQNPNPLIRYFGAQVYLTRYRDAQAGIQWSDGATSEGWIPLYLVYLKLAMTKEPESLRDHLDLLLRANPEDPRIIYAISALREATHFEQLNRDLANRYSEYLYLYIGDSRYTKVLTHAIFEGFLDANSVKGHEHHVMEKFACVYSLIEYPSDDSAIWELANRFRKFGRFWDEDTEGPVKLKLTEDELRTIISFLSPHQEFGLASFQELPISNLYLRLYRFFAEIEWRLDHGDVVLG